jgi:putative phosphoribosyl transferase
MLTSSIVFQNIGEKVQVQRHADCVMRWHELSSDLDFELLRKGGNFAMNQPFADRREAGAELATKLGHFSHRDDVVVLALPRGGVPVAFEVAEALDAPLDIFLVRKLGMPGYPELAMGALASGGVRVLNEDVVRWYGISNRAIDEVARDEQRELERREREYRRGRPMADLKKKIAILVDDGLATGSTMRAAVQAVRQQDPARVIVAVPVGAPSTCAEFADVTDETICARTPEPFSAVGLWDRDFSQTTDEEVHKLLGEHAQSREDHQRGRDHGERRPHA